MWSLFCWLRMFRSCVSIVYTNFILLYGTVYILYTMNWSDNHGPCEFWLLKSTCLFLVRRGLALVSCWPNAILGSALCLLSSRQPLSKEKLCNLVSKIEVDKNQKLFGHLYFCYIFSHFDTVLSCSFKTIKLSLITSTTCLSTMCYPQLCWSTSTIFYVIINYR